MQTLSKKNLLVLDTLDGGPFRLLTSVRYGVRAGVGVIPRVFCENNQFSYDLRHAVTYLIVHCTFSFFPEIFFFFNKNARNLPDTLDVGLFF